ncbi:aminopeptidase P family protein [Oribacterium sp. WCC10]|uniref:aminopeptidase P family protein n=1 Tax=Oribacterium sp. WCC10 TaxID=1855343 RepID=UPI0008E1561F|nr:aminopeptidase P family protein [Oribacterium sp. WCC10]SFG31772.1 Xaa-Pro aminopeptidase [Oribacterium sp. WCC10]
MNKQLSMLREEMKQAGIDTYLIPTDDFHQSEYVGEYFRAIRYLSGFTGEGNLVVTMDSAALFTDGRYFIQAEKELEGRDITLMKMGEPGVPELRDYLVDKTPAAGRLGFDGRCVDNETGTALRRRLDEKEALVYAEEDLVGKIWENRPPLASSGVWILSEKYTGKSAEEKLSELRKYMKDKNAQVHIVTSLDDIAWILNLRGDDIPCNPVFLSYLMVCEDGAVLYMNKASLNDEVSAYLSSLKVDVKDYDSFYEDVKYLKNVTVLLEKAKTNYRTISNLDESVSVVSDMLPSSRWKSRKNPVEIENIKKAHIKDGVAVTEFIYFMKHAFDENGKLTGDAKTLLGSEEINEWNVAAVLENFRKAQEGYIEPSFTTISAYGPNAALPHYAPTAESFAEIEPRGLYLVDSGAQFPEGTTDITRTMAMGPVTDEERKHFTMVLKAHLRLSDVKFLQGSSGITVDLAAREVFWQEGMNFNHGTGHGVGFCLNVHERPNAIRFRKLQGRMEDEPLCEGNLTSDEPGLYIEGKHGIRTENLTLVKKWQENEYGTFYRFEIVTMAPIDLDAIDFSIMEERDIRLLNAYHKDVYEKLSPYFSGEKLEWLKYVTREV